MADQIVYVDRSEIREGKLEELRTAIRELVDFVESNEAQALAYNVYINEDGTEMTVVQVHPDSTSLEFHMDVAGPAFLKFKELIKLLAIDIYGRLSDKLRKQLHHKAQMLGSGTVVVHELEAGFTRFEVQ
jgi:quinol monooxygenase YgiN